mmetsp:Transcript_17814/g.35570  ORF Transcript_17814/g.35570 Transcript_17814/m.35570 type:complete len:262 (-) Transcript_17814:1711-2496(-)
MGMTCFSHSFFRFSCFPLVSNNAAPELKTGNISGIKSNSLVSISVRSENVRPLLTRIGVSFSLFCLLGLVFRSSNSLLSLAQSMAKAAKFTASASSEADNRGLSVFLICSSTMPEFENSTSSAVTLSFTNLSSIPTRTGVPGVPTIRVRISESSQPSYRRQGLTPMPCGIMGFTILRTTTASDTRPFLTSNAITNEQALTKLKCSLLSAYFTAEVIWVEYLNMYGTLFDVASNLGHSLCPKHSISVAKNSKPLTCSRVNSV